MCGLTFRSLIHFEIIFVYDVKEYSNFIILHVTVQFSQHHLLKRLPFFHCIFLLPYHRLVDHRCVGLFLDFLSCSIVLSLYVSVFVPVSYCFDDCILCSTVWSKEAWFLQVHFLSKDCICYSGSFVFTYKLKKKI